MPFACSSTVFASAIARRIPPSTFSPAFFAASQKCPKQPRQILVKPPTAGRIDMSLSLSITKQVGIRHAGIVSASNAMPADIAPCDHRDAMTLFAFSLDACAMPSAAEDRGARMRGAKLSYTLSIRRGKPEMPPACRKALMPSQPASGFVRIGLVSDIQTIRSSGVLKT